MSDKPSIPFDAMTMHILRVLGESPGPLNVYGLSAATGIRTSVVCVAVCKLYLKGYIGNERGRLNVFRVAMDKDYFFITEAGRRYLYQ